MLFAGQYGSKRNLIQDIDPSVKQVNRVQSEQAFPPVEMEDLAKPRSYSEPPKAGVNSQELIYNRTDMQNQDSVDNTVEEAIEAGHSHNTEGIVNNTSEWTVSSFEKSSKSEKSVKSFTGEQRDGTVARPRGLTVDGLWHISTNFEEFYKKTSEPVQNWMENGNEAGLVDSKSQGTTQELESFGDYHKPGMDPEQDELIKSKGDYPSKENLSIKFDEGDTELAQAEEGLAALCVGK